MIASTCSCLHDSLQSYLSLPWQFGNTMIASSSFRHALSHKAPNKCLRNAPPPRVRLPQPVRFTEESASDFAPATRGMGIGALIHKDHDKIRSLFAEYAKAAAPEAKQELGLDIIRELLIHGNKEEDVVYPVITKLFGDEVGQHLHQEHRILNAKLDTLHKMDATKDPEEFDKQVAAVQADFVRHSREEMEGEIPRLVKHIGVEASRELGALFQQATGHAARPAPEADKPPLSSMAKAAAAPLDVAADAIRFKGQAPGLGAENTIPPKEQSWLRLGIWVEAEA